jgi:hypothetical protein
MEYSKDHNKTSLTNISTINLEASIVPLHHILEGKLSPVIGGMDLCHIKDFARNKS